MGACGSVPIKEAFAPLTNRDLSIIFNPQFKDEKRTIIRKPDEMQMDLILPSPKPNGPVFNRIYGSLMGLAIGDALGAPVEFRPYEYIKANPVKDFQEGGTWGLKKGQFTDDTTMALCLAISLILCRDFQPYDQLVRYKWWYRQGYMSSTGECFDIGAATRNAVRTFEDRQTRLAKKNSIDLNQIDFISDSMILKKINLYCSEDNAAGNGGLMRLAPVPLFFYQDPIKAVEYSGISAAITHGDQRASDACRYYGALIVAALRGEKKGAILAVDFYERHQEWFGENRLHPDVLNIVQGSYRTKKNGYESGIRGKGFVINSLEAALWAFYSDENSFSTGVLAAVNLGDDTDTTAAIYGQLAGAYYGYEKLPEKWRDLIYAKDFIHCVSSWIDHRGQQWFNQEQRRKRERNDETTENTRL